MNLWSDIQSMPLVIQTTIFLSPMLVVDYQISFHFIIIHTHNNTHVGESGQVETVFIKTHVSYNVMNIF